MTPECVAVTQLASRVGAVIINCLVAVEKNFLGILRLKKTRIFSYGGLGLCCDLHLKMITEFPLDRLANVGNLTGSTIVRMFDIPASYCAFNTTHKSRPLASLVPYSRYRTSPTKTSNRICTSCLRLGHAASEHLAIWGLCTATTRIC